MLDTGNGRLGGLQDAPTLAKATPVQPNCTGWVCPRCSTPNSPTQAICFMCSQGVRE